jgi:hypothetical protein
LNGALAPERKLLMPLFIRIKNPLLVFEEILVKLRVKPVMHLLQHNGLIQSNGQGKMGQNLKMNVMLFAKQVSKYPP